MDQKLLGPIAIFRFSSLGDVVLATSFVKLLSLFYQEVSPHQIPSIYFFTFPEFANLVEGHPLVKEVITIPRFRGIFGIFKFYQSLKKELLRLKITFIFDLQSSLRSNFAKAILNVKSSTFPKQRMTRFLFFLGINLYGKQPMSLVERYVNFLFHFWNLEKENKAKLQVSLLNQNRNRSEPLTFVPKHKGTVEKKLFDLPTSYVVFLPSAAHSKKRWPVNYFLELSEMIYQKSHHQMSVVILAGKEDIFCKDFDHKIGVMNLAGKTNFFQSIDIIKNSKLVIGNDTGFMHISEALKIPYYTFFGPTSEYFGFISHTKYGHAISRKLWCRPCSATGSGRCFRSRRFCLEEITALDAWQHIASDVLQARG
ncbi:MAG: glycosyltransferase family 9 protein [Bacteriovoracaceae bacterium]|nr:glycosyltransferase family 9 protein [Bacteriovoracaceae bacterium]